MLAFAGTGVSDFIQHGRNGLLVRSDDELGTALATLAQSPSSRAELAADQHGSEFGYTWDQVLQTCEQVYRRAFEQVSKPMPPAPGSPQVPGSLPVAGSLPVPGPPSVPGSQPILRHP